MKKIILLLAFISCISIEAQNNCASTYTLFNFDNKSNATKIHALGASPQIDFLMGITEPKKFIEAVFKNKNNQEKYKRDIEELDKVLKIIGFQNGINDSELSEKSLSVEYISYGTIGNLGGNSNGYQYVKLLPKESKGFRAMKITSPKGCYFYIFTKCGNLFYPNIKPNCPSITINIAENSLNVECKSSPKKKKQTISTEIFLITQKTKVTIEQCNDTIYRTGKNKGHTIVTGIRRIKRKECEKITTKIDTTFLYMDNYSQEIDICEDNSKHEIYIPEFQTTEVVCENKTFNLPITLKKRESSSTSYNNEDVVIKRRIYVNADEKIITNICPEKITIDIEKRRKRPQQQQ